MQNNPNETNSSIHPRAARRAARGQGAWIGGAMLIALGALLLLQNMNLLVLNNWWALFILLPAVGAFSTAWYTYQQDGRLSSPARASLLGGIVLVMVAMIFLFDLNWGILGPVLLVLAGVGVLANAVLPG